MSPAGENDRERSSTDGSADRREALALLAATAAVGSIGLGAGGAAGALLGAELAGTEAAAGLSLGLLVLGSAASALAISRLTGRIGRGASLAVGYAAGVAGAVLVVLAAAAESLTTLLIGSLLVGGANAAIFFTRYAAAEVAGDRTRGRAVGLVFFTTTIGAVASPLLLAPSGRLAETVGLPRLSGLYLLAIVAFGLSATTLGYATRPSTRANGAGVGLRSGARAAPTLAELAQGTRTTPARLGLAVLAAANFVMVAVMAVAPVHLTAHDYDLEMVGMVISFHIAGMFAPSPLSGWLADRVGPSPVALTGCLLILIAGIAGALVEHGSAHQMIAVLAILGIGWNFSVVGASTLIADEVPASLRVHVEGVGEIAMGLAAAAGAPIAGVVVALGGFDALSLAGAAIAACALLTGARTLARQRPRQHGQRVHWDGGARYARSISSAQAVRIGVPPEAVAGDE
jgi:MFS family permease